MITLDDCEAFCDADPNSVHEVACRECLGMVQAYARAHGSIGHASEIEMPSPLPQGSGVEVAANYRLAA